LPQLAISLNYLQGKDAGNGIEINPDKVAELYCEQVIVDLDFVSLTEMLPIHKF